MATRRQGPRQIGAIPRPEGPQVRTQPAQRAVPQTQSDRAGLEGMTQAFDNFFGQAQQGIEAVAQARYRNEQIQARDEQEALERERAAQGQTDALRGDEMDPDLADEDAYYRAYSGVKASNTSSDAAREFFEWYQTDFMRQNPTGDLAEARDQWASENLTGFDDPEVESQVLGNFYEATDKIVSDHQEASLGLQINEDVQELGQMIHDEISAGDVTVDRMADWMSKYETLNPLNPEDAGGFIMGRVQNALRQNPKKATSVLGMLEKDGTGVNGRSFADSFPEKFNELSAGAARDSAQTTTKAQRDKQVEIQDRISEFQRDPSEEALNEIMADIGRYRETHGASDSYMQLRDQATAMLDKYIEDQANMGLVSEYMDAPELRSDEREFLSDEFMPWFKSQTGKSNLTQLEDTDDMSAPDRIAAMIMGLDGAVPDEVSDDLSETLTLSNDLNRQGKTLEALHQVAAARSPSYVKRFLDTEAAQRFDVARPLLEAGNLSGAQAAEQVNEMEWDRAEPVDLSGKFDDGEDEALGKIEDEVNNALGYGLIDSVSRGFGRFSDAMPRIGAVEDGPSMRDSRGKLTRDANKRIRRYAESLLSVNPGMSGEDAIKRSVETFADNMEVMGSADEPRVVVNAGHLPRNRMTREARDKWANDVAQVAQDMPDLLGPYEAEDIGVARMSEKSDVLRLYDSTTGATLEYAPGDTFEDREGNTLRIPEDPDKLEETLEEAKKQGMKLPGDNFHLVPMPDGNVRLAYSPQGPEQEESWDDLAQTHEERTEERTREARENSVFHMAEKFREEGLISETSGITGRIPKLLSSEDVIDWLNDEMDKGLMQKGHFHSDKKHRGSSDTYKAERFNAFTETGGVHKRAVDTASGTSVENADTVRGDVVVGADFNMDREGARAVWAEAGLDADKFDKVKRGEAKLTDPEIESLFHHDINRLEHELNTSLNQPLPTQQHLAVLSFMHRGNRSPGLNMLMDLNNQEHDKVIDRMLDAGRESDSRTDVIRRYQEAALYAGADNIDKLPEVGDYFADAGFDVGASSLPQPEGEMSDVLNLLGEAEAPQRGYDQPSDFTQIDPPSNLSNMTVRQVLDWQKRNRRAGAESTAAGRYQIIYSTLSSLVEDGTLSPGDRFDQKAQDGAALALMRRRGLDSFKRGRIDGHEFARRLSKEWAGLPDPSTGQSHYYGDGLNGATVGVDQMMSIIQSIPRN